MTIRIPPTPPAPPTRLTARSPEDLLAVVRVVLGFEPADSVVMLTLGARHPCHARIDLPEVPPGALPDIGDLDELAEALLRPAAGHGASAVVLVVFTADDRLARRASRRVGRRLGQAGVDCIEALRVHAGRWHPLTGPARPGGVPYDVSTHPFVAAAVLEGRVIHGSRGELAATVAPDPVATALVERCPVPPSCDPTADPGWVAATVARHAAAGTTPDPAEAARLLTAIATPSARDAAWCAVTRADARRHVELWSGLVRRCPRDLLPHAAGVLAFVAWVSGDGALAWCGVDRAREVDPGHTLAALVADLLEGVVPPDAWEQQRHRLGSAS